MNAADQAVVPRKPLAEALREQIKREGPITFRDWMEAALYDRQGGYYRRSDRERWGREGDYRTSPERSPLFAATFARYFATLYDELGSPNEWTIVEVGAATGQFAEQVLMTLQRRFPQVFSVTRYVVDEASAESRTRARARLARFGDRVHFSSLTEIDVLDPGIVFSNELLDAFPVHRVVVRNGQLCELYVAVNEAGTFQWTSGALSTPRLVEHLKFNSVHLAADQIAEINLCIEEWFERVAAKLNTGYVVTVDYGTEALDLYGAPERQQGTLRAYHRHQIAVDVLARPGEQDITSTVDWTLVKRVGGKLGLETVALERQDRFLRSAGLLDELELMNEIQDDAEKLRLRTGAREMILPGGMAESFQVLVQKKAQ
jgi:SAM-dependent MidA family methyltransferase